MSPMSRTAFLLATALSLGSAGASHADRYERRKTVGVRIDWVTLLAFESRDSISVYGLEAGYHRGLFDWLDGGAHLAYLSRPSAALADARVDGVGGPGFVLYTDLHMVEAAAHLRLIVDVGPFNKLQPIVDARAGLTARFLRDVALFDPNEYLALAQGNEMDVIPSVAGRAGLTYRLTDGFQIGATFGATWASGHQARTGQLEVSWFRY